MAASEAHDRQDDANRDSKLDEMMASVMAPLYSDSDHKNKK